MSADALHGCGKFPELIFAADSHRNTLNGYQITQLRQERMDTLRKFSAL